MENIHEADRVPTHRLVSAALSASVRPTASARATSSQSDHVARSRSRSLAHAARPAATLSTFQNWVRCIRDEPELHRVLLNLYPPLGRTRRYFQRDPNFSGNFSEGTRIVLWSHLRPDRFFDFSPNLV
jgi:hypothetical protein